jgi:hypothetical protein
MEKGEILNHKEHMHRGFILIADRKQKRYDLGRIFRQITGKQDFFKIDVFHNAKANNSRSNINTLLKTLFSTLKNSSDKKKRRISHRNKEKKKVQDKDTYTRKLHERKDEWIAIMIDRLTAQADEEDEAGPRDPFRKELKDLQKNAKRPNGCMQICGPLMKALWRISNRVSLTPAIPWKRR